MCVLILSLSVPIYLPLLLSPLPHSLARLLAGSNGSPFDHLFAPHQICEVQRGPAFGVVQVRAVNNQLVDRVTARRHWIEWHESFAPSLSSNIEKLDGSFRRINIVFSETPVAAPVSQAQTATQQPPNSYRRSHATATQQPRNSYTAASTATQQPQPQPQ